MALIPLEIVSDQYFPAAGYRLRAGRLFLEGEPPGRIAPLIVNETFVKKHMNERTPDQALGRVLLNTENGRVTEVGFVVGVVNDLNLSTHQIVAPHIFESFTQAPRDLTRFLGSFVVRTTGDPLPLISRISKILEPNGLRLNEPSTLEDRVNASVATRQFETNLLLAFATVALILAIVGIHGVLSYAVSQRTREIGIRVAMGASRGDVLGGVLRDGWKLTLVGVVAGVAGALAFTQTMRSMLTNVEPTDPLVLASVCALIFTIATVAALIPARRATRVDPMNALRHE
jgi:ABC-type antimicrobial peptide transport system permease subunit